MVFTLDRSHFCFLEVISRDTFRGSFIRSLINPKECHLCDALQLHGSACLTTQKVFRSIPPLPPLELSATHCVWCCKRKPLGQLHLPVWWPSWTAKLSTDLCCCLSASTNPRNAQIFWECDLHRGRQRRYLQTSRPSPSVYSPVLPLFAPLGTKGRAILSQLETPLSCSACEAASG